MQDGTGRYGGGSPLFSIIIPLEYHRGQWEQSWLGWTSQTADKSLYEIILVVPPDFRAREELKVLAGDRARLEFTDSEHDIGLCAFGATKARGSHLFFTESHCWPEPGVIELCIRAIEAHPDWAGFSCHSVPICHNRLSVAEAAMYQADIEFGMKQHPWRKVLDQCFVTRRDVYWECGGLREELGHFAEWVLAAAYHAKGYAIGYLEEARFHHYYVGELGELKTFTLDFVQGEIRYLGEARRDPGSELLEVPVEWVEWAGFDVSLARAALNALVHDGFASRGRKWPGEKLRAFWRWGALALCGDLGARVAARLAVMQAYFGLCALMVIGQSEAIARSMRRYIAALIHLQRLECIRRIAGPTGPAARFLGDRVLGQAGFHALESSSGHIFRWSEPQAAVRIQGSAGRNTVRIRSPVLREPLREIGAHFYVNGARVDASAIAIGPDSYTLRLDLPPSGIAILAWSCPVFRGIGDPRRLGLSVVSIEVSQDIGASIQP
ncbi:glycosyltransferase family 2 protein [Bradyrhizobium tunisiense]|uniref:glycosyltransferase family 2 protein n=1 Tax=Bradyrhizobium tunisiense TaxID=3278709 RepID=UPI0035DA277B